MISIKLYSIIILTALISLQSTEDEPEPVKEQDVILETDANYLTVINLMKPNMADQAKVINLLNTGVTDGISSIPGFISASLHQSLDNNYVINYAKWEDGESLQQAADLIGAGNAPSMGEAFSLSSPDYHPFALTAQFTTLDGSVNVDEAGKYLTVINLLQPLEGVSQSELVEILKKGVEQEVMLQDGFISSSIHTSLDNDYIINYAQWENGEALQAFVDKLSAGEAPLMGKAFANATADYHPFQVEKNYFPNN